MTVVTAFDSRALRDALGAFATGVAVVASPDAEGEPVGITINSFASVSLEPPLVLWSIARTSERFSHFETCDRYTINVLASDQEAVAKRFVKEHRFADDAATCTRGQDGAVFLDGALASFACAPVNRLDGGDHVILVGRVLSLRSRPDGSGLTYFRGRFGVAS